jgi:hypothetical protein
MFTEPGWNLHAPADIGLDDASGRFEADRSLQRFSKARSDGLGEGGPGGVLEVNLTTVKAIGVISVFRESH